MKYCFDIESNGLLDVTDTIHCIVLKNIETGEVLTPSVDEAVDLLSKAELIIGHNIIKFDIPVLKKLTNYTSNATVFDTLVATRLVYPDVAESDFSRQNFPKECIGRHSLKA